MPSNNGTAPITIALGQFEELVGRGLAQLLRDDHPSSRIIATELDNAGLIQVAEQEAPRVIALDESAVIDPAMLRRLRVARPTVAVVVIAHEPTSAYGMLSLASGASCVARSASAADIFAAIHLAAKGGRMFVPAAGQRTERTLPPKGLLTAREIDVLELLSRNEPYAAIAYALKISIETARTHGANIRLKLGVSSKQELVGIPIPSRQQADAR
jgi:DNA-binding NarL/FixJ family response regulator